MSDLQGVLWAVMLVAMLASALLNGYHRKAGGKQTGRWLYLAYGAAAVGLGAAAALLALNGSVLQGLVAAGAAAIVLLFALLRDKRRMGREA